MFSVSHHISDAIQRLVGTHGVSAYSFKYVDEDRTRNYIKETGRPST